MHIETLSLPHGPFTWFDGGALLLLVLFAWRGYRRGLLSWLAGIGATILSLLLSVVLTPLLTPLASLAFARQTGWGSLIGQRLVFVILIVVLRVLLGFAFRELIGSLRPLLRVLPPLALADHLLGIPPSLAVGCLIVVVLLVAALFLPVDQRIHRAAADSYAARLAGQVADTAAQRLPAHDILAQPSQVFRTW